MAASSSNKAGSVTPRSGFVSITGRPNVGKSTFLNAVLGQKVSIVTPRPQTTRNRIIGVKTLRHAQIVFIDTPGIHRSRHRLGAFMVKEAKQALRDVDAVLYMVEPVSPSEADIAVIKLLKHISKPVLLLINKTDTVKKPKLLPVMEEYGRLYPFDEIIPVSALRGDGLDVVLEKTIKRLASGPKYYPDDLVTDRLERFMVAEIIREKVMWATVEEVPYSVAVEIMGWSERTTSTLNLNQRSDYRGGRKQGLCPVFISANIYVEKQGQKGIIIGKKGERLKAIGISARADIEKLLGTKIFLELWVKVKKHWREDKAALMELGFE